MTSPYPSTPACQWSPELNRFTTADEPPCGATTTIYLLRRHHRKHKQTLVDQAYVCSSHLPAARTLYPSRYYDVVIA